MRRLNEQGSRAGNLSHHSGRRKKRRRSRHTTSGSDVVDVELNEQGSAGGQFESLIQRWRRKRTWISSIGVRASGSDVVLVG